MAVFKMSSIVMCASLFLNMNDELPVEQNVEHVQEVYISRFIETLFSIRNHPSHKRVWQCFHVVRASRLSEALKLLNLTCNGCSSFFKN